MSAPVSFALAVAGLIVSAKARLNAVLFGQPVSIPWLGVLFAVALLVLVVIALCVVRAILQDRPARYPRTQSAT